MTIDWKNAKDIPPPFGSEILIFSHDDGSAGDRGFIRYRTWAGNKGQQDKNIRDNKFFFWAYINKPDITNEKKEKIDDRCEILDL